LSEAVVPPTIDQVLTEIRAELRSIIRQRDELGNPLDAFGEVVDSPLGEPRFYVLFDGKPRKKVRGLKARMPSITMPDERISDQIFEFAKSVWQLKDRLKLWVTAHGLAIDIEAEARKCLNLLITADLANWKKHGENKNRSGLSPRLAEVRFDTSKNGVVELYYDGASKEKELLVSVPKPIPYYVDVVADDGRNVVGNAVEIISAAFEHWLSVIRKIGILNGADRETEHLNRMLFPTV
jgi:hypothetical protein